MFNFKKIRGERGTRLVIEKITIPQKCDMGSGYGYLEIIDKVTLAEVLEFYKYSNSWGIITIYNDSGEIIRKFDYDVHSNNNILYHQLSSWEYKFLVKKVNFTYCHQNKDIEIFL